MPNTRQAAAAVLDRGHVLLAALLTQGTARPAVSSRCMDNGFCQCTAVPIIDVGVPNMLYVAHVGWCPSCYLSSPPTCSAALSTLLLSLPFASFCSNSVFSFLYTRLRESNQGPLNSWFFGIAARRWPAYYPLYPAELSVGLASCESLLKLSIINCVSGLFTIH